MLPTPPVAPVTLLPVFRCRLAAPGATSALIAIAPAAALLKEDVHRLPKRVIEDLDQLLVNERIRVGRGERVGEGDLLAVRAGAGHAGGSLVQLLGPGQRG